MNFHDALLRVDVMKMLVPDVALLEMVVRGSLVYLGIFVVLRVFRRPTGQLGIADVLLITIIADAAQNAMAGGYESTTSGLVLICTIVFWDRLIDHLAYRYEWFGRLAEPPPAPLVRDGVPIRAALEKHKISENDLLSHLREHGVEDPRQVRLCILETDGKISVLRAGSD